MTGADLVEEDAKFLNYLRENGWDGEIGESDEKKLITASYSNEEVAEEKI